MTPPDSPTTNDGGPKLHTKRKQNMLFIAGMQISMKISISISSIKKGMAVVGLHKTSPISCTYDPADN